MNLQWWRSASDRSGYDCTCEDFEWQKWLWLYVWGVRVTEVVMTVCVALKVYCSLLLGKWNSLPYAYHKIKLILLLFYIWQGKFWRDIIGLYSQKRNKGDITWNLIVKTCLHMRCLYFLLDMSTDAIFWLLIFIIYI